jgi:hypothetical protein
MALQTPLEFLSLDRRDNMKPHASGTSRGGNERTKDGQDTIPATFSDFLGKMHSGHWLIVE